MAPLRIDTISHCQSRLVYALYLLALLLASSGNRGAVAIYHRWRHLRNIKLRHCVLPIVERSGYGRVFTVPIDAELETTTVALLE